MLAQTIMQIVLPLVFVLTTWRGRYATRRDWGLNTAPQAAGMLFLWVVIPWYLTSAYLRWVWLALFLAALLISYHHVDAANPAPAIARWAVLINLGTALVLGALAALGLMGYQRPAGALDLTVPLEPGLYYVGNGGDNVFINGHQVAPAQRYAVDFLGLSSWGNRRNSLSNELESYPIFGKAILSPCAGSVLSVVDGFPDLPVGEQDTENLAGNYVALDCGGIGVLLAHMQASSVQVTAGEQVAVGQFLGRVGNSGNTSEPHLHIHAVRGSSTPNLLDGEPVPITFNGRFLVRNDILRLD